jgi:hypothetical protein
MKTGSLFSVPVCGSPCPQVVAWGSETAPEEGTPGEEEILSEQPQEVEFMAFQPEIRGRF